MFRRMWAFLTGGTPVVLLDSFGEVYKTIAYTSLSSLCDKKLIKYFPEHVPEEKGFLYCHVYWCTKVGKCKLLPDGKIDKSSSHTTSTYINYWKKG